jgi:hypothetical protein
MKRSGHFSFHVFILIAIGTLYHQNNDFRELNRAICQGRKAKDHFTLTLQQDDFIKLNHTICQGVEVPGIVKKPQVSQSVFYVTGKFRVGDMRWNNDLRGLGCRVLKSTCIPEHNIRVFKDEFPISLLRHPKYEWHRQFLSNVMDASSRGAGQKLLIVLSILQRNDVPSNSYVVYTNGNPPDVILYMSHVVESMALQDHDFAIQQWRGGPETKYTKGDIFQHFGLSDYGKLPETNTFQYSASFFVVQKTPSTIEFFSEWANRMEDYHLVSDEPSKLPNVPEFYENRHDQSMLSMVLKFIYNDGGPTKTEIEIDVNNPYVPDKQWLSSLTTYTYSLERSKPLACKI